ncbi:MAG TPA: transposase [Chloroflexota bacterium]|nr:transposase [Chloroflexota bacterium]
MSVRTIALTLRPTFAQSAALERLQRQFNAACDYISRVAWEQHEFNKVRLQRLVYRDVRARFGLLAQHTIRAIAVVAGSYTAEKSRPHTFRPDAAVVLDTPRLYRVAHNRASIATLDGRQTVQLGIGGHQRQMLRVATRLAEADLVRDQKGRWRLLVSAHYADPPLTEATEVLGVDLGRRDIAATSDGNTFSGAEVTRVRDRFARNRSRRSRNASKGTRSSRRRARALQKRLSGRERRFQRHVNHVTSKAIVQKAQAPGRAMALENLTGIRERTNALPRSREERRRSNSWAFAQLRCFLTYKARAAGVPLVLVDPAYTSQICHCCLHLGERNGKVFHCVNPRCGFRGDADINGASMIALMGANVMRPRGPWLACQLLGS